MDSGFQQLNSKSFSVELGFRIPIVSGIPDSYSCIPDSKTQDSGFHKQEFPRFRIPQATISRIPESGHPYMGRHIPCAGGRAGRVGFVGELGGRGGGGRRCPLGGGFVGGGGRGCLSSSLLKFSPSWLLGK